MPRGKSARKRRPPVNRHFKIELVLPPEMLSDYLAHLREPSTTVDTAHAWLSERGFGGRFSRSAVARHKRHVLERFEDQRDAEETARRFASLATLPQYDNENLLVGALLGAEQEVLKAIFSLRRQGYARAIAPQEIMEVLDVLEKVMTVRQQLTKLRRRPAGDGPAPDGPRGQAPEPAGGTTEFPPGYIEEIVAAVRKLQER